MKAWAVLAALFLGALALRPQLVGVGPLIPEIDEDLDVSHAVAGLLTTIPVLCMGLFAIPGAYVTTGINLGSALSSALAVPIAAAWGGWRAALAVFSACTILCFAAWLFFTPPVRGDRVQTDAPPLPWGRRVVWGLAIVFALQSIVYYGLARGCPTPFRSAAGATPLRVPSWA